MGLPSFIATRSARRASSATRAAIRRRCNWVSCPLLEAGVVDSEHPDRRLQVGRVGRRAQGGDRTAAREASDNFKAYGVSGHRHHPETVQELAAHSKTPVNLVFTPHLVPMIRGILSTLYARLTRTDVDVQALFEKRYAGEPFVDVMPPGSAPDTRSVRASNVARIAVHRPADTDMVTVIVVEDNLVKGARARPCRT
jgi:N-acetyl-gamma-glutamyl-phosphate reductase